MPAGGDQTLLEGRHQTESPHPLAGDQGLGGTKDSKTEQAPKTKTSAKLIEDIWERRRLLRG